MTTKENHNLDSFSVEHALKMQLELLGEVKKESLVEKSKIEFMENLLKNKLPVIRTYVQNNENWELVEKKLTANQLLYILKNKK